ncbi:MAG: HAMP domain-containing histidine kinase [Actinomycetota bacterium]|nr:HAMP domain-containing histidine kinase [Actinomycetota bacterium]
MVRLSLRWRVVVAFGLSSLLLTSLFAVATWQLASGYMLRQREQSATAQAEIHLRLVEETLRLKPYALDELLTGLAGQPKSTILLRRAESWLTSGRQVDPAVLPDRLLALAREGTPARQRLVVGTVPVLAVAFPVAAEHGIYVELFSLGELDRSFRFLSSLLVAGTALSALLGAALGWWTSRRALRPLTELTTAAARVAQGDLQARLPEQSDPDLTPLAATFNATASALEQRVRRDARFAGDVSHELRSPLTTMVNASEVLQRRRAELPSTARQAVDLLVSEVQRFRHMVVDLLEISRIDQEADDRARETVDLGDLVRNVAATRSDTAPIDVEQPPPLVLADRRCLDRVIANLLENAERHGGGPVRIAISRRNGCVRLEVDDAGPGVPAQLREQVFERFARGARAGDRSDDSGSGLGLAVVAQHVRRHGGAVWVEDRPGGGARFVVELAELQR